MKGELTTLQGLGTPRPAVPTPLPPGAPFPVLGALVTPKATQQAPGCPLGGGFCGHLSDGERELTRDQPRPGLVVMGGGGSDPRCSPSVKLGNHVHTARLWAAARVR